MTVPKWEASHLYQPGDIVQSRLSAPVTNQAIPNAGFESGDTSWTKSNTTIDNSGGSPFAGTWFAKMVYAAGATGYVRTSSILPVVPGQSVFASCMYNPSGAAVGVGGQVRILWYDVSNAYISGKDSVGNGIDTSTGSGWRKSSVTGNAPSNAKGFRVQGDTYNTNASGVVLLDTFTLTVNGGASGNALIFEATQSDPATSAASEPVWPTTVSATVVDGGVTWTAIDATVVTWQASPILESGAAEPTWPATVGEFVSDGTVSWEAISRRIEDENCPNSKIVVILSSKVFAADGDIVRFSATANPKDWTSEQDAGYLPTGLQSANANDVAVMAQYRSNLVPFNASSFQNWQVDPDPEAMALLDQMEGIGSTWPMAAQPVADDLFYLSQLGVRSVGIAASTDNLSAGDVGMPIDELVQQAMAVANANQSRVLSTYYPAQGQYWLTFAEYPAGELSSISGDITDGYIGDSGTSTFTVSGGVAPYSFSATGTMPPGKSLSTAGLVTGQFIGEGDDEDFHDYPITIRAVDANGSEVTKNISVRVTNFSISGDIPDGDAGSTGTGSFSNAHGIAPFTYTVDSGTTPPGWSLDSDGSYAYTYSAGGVYSCVIKCVDARGNIATLNVTCTVAASDIFVWRSKYVGDPHVCLSVFVEDDVIGVGHQNAIVSYSLDRGVTFAQTTAYATSMFVYSIVKYEGDWYCFGGFGSDSLASKALGDSFTFSPITPPGANNGSFRSFVRNGYVYIAPVCNSGNLKLYRFDGSGYTTIDTGLAVIPSGEQVRGIEEVDDGWLILSSTGTKCRVIKTANLATGFSVALSLSVVGVGIARLGTTTLLGAGLAIYRSYDDGATWGSATAISNTNGYDYLMHNAAHFVSAHSVYVTTSANGSIGSWTQRLSAESILPASCGSVGCSTNTLAAFPCSNGYLLIGDIA